MSPRPQLRSSAQQSGNPSARTVPIWLWVGLVGLIALLALNGIADARFRLIVLGFVALALFTASVFYVPRKRMFWTRLGTLHTWMIGHMVLGGLLLVAVMLHAGFTHIGASGWVLYGLTFAEVGTGIWGLYELRATPRRFSKFASDDFMYPSAIRRRIEVLGLGIDTSLERRGEAFAEWYRAHYADVLAGTTEHMPDCEGYPRKNHRHAAEVHESLAEIVRLKGLQQRVDAADRRSRLWLYAHVPIAVAYTAFVVIHVFGWVYYR